MSAAANQSQPVEKRKRFSLPELISGVRPRDKVAIIGVPVDGSVPEGVTPIDQRACQVRMGNGNGADPAESADSLRVASSSRLVQSQSTFPCGVWTSKARCPMAKPGVVPMPVRLGSTASIRVMMVLLHLREGGP